MTPHILTRLPPPTDARLAYGPEPTQFGDLRLPPGPGLHPTAIVIHGGFWRAQYDLEHAGHLCAALACVGLATWNVEYRRVGQRGGGWPGTLDDVVAAAGYLRNLATTYPLDLHRVIVLGHSAGGQLALWLAAGQHNRQPHHTNTPVGVPLRGAVSLAGVCDLRQAWRLNLSRGAVGEFLGGTPDELPARYHGTSPADLLPLGVPQLLVHGALDQDVPLTLSEDYTALARSQGDQVTLLVLPRATHLDLIDPTAPTWPAVQQAIMNVV